jgi:hypothetical protein
MTFPIWFEGPCTCEHDLNKDHWFDGCNIEGCPCIAGLREG